MPAPPAGFPVARPSVTAAVSELTLWRFWARGRKPASGGRAEGRQDQPRPVTAPLWRVGPRRFLNRKTPMTKFSDLKLDPKVLKAIAEAGYETPTPIQAGAIPPALEGRDVLGIAQTGTGKTASFTLPMITLLGRGRARARMPRSLVLCPTRELAAQVAENFETYAKHTRLTKALLIGGVSFNEQDKLIDRGVDVLIATPGRLLDHFERGKLLLTGVQIMVVDEADRMLDMGFIPDIERIFQLTPFTRQTLFFSATMAPEIERITNTFLHAPERIEVARQATTSETITQKLVELTPTRKDQTAKQKRELLRALIDAEGPATDEGGLKNAIIFCNRKTEVDIVAKSLKAHGYDAAPIHGDLDQRVRMATLDGFRDGSLRFLIASDVAARGLDIPAVSHVFNFDLPSHAEDYVHRIGRTGRAGRQGTAISIATPSDEKYLSAIENLVKQTLPRAALPQDFSLSDAAQSAPRPQGDRGGRSSTSSRTRSRRSSRSEDRRDEPRRDEAAPVEVGAPVEAARPQTDRRDTPRPAAEREPARDAERRSSDSRSSDSRRSDGRSWDNRDDSRGDRNGDRHESRGDGRRDDRRDDRVSDRSGDRNGDRRYRDRDRGPSVLGMGDHVPDFLTTSFAEAIAVTDARIAASAARAAQAPEAHADAPEAALAPASETAEAPTTRRSRSRKSRAKTPEADTVSATEADQAQAPEPVAASADEPPAETPKPRRTRSRRKPAAADEAAASEAPAQLSEERDAEQEAALAPPPAVEPAVPTEALPGDALPEERAAAEAVADGSVNAAPVGENTADEPRKRRRSTRRSTKAAAPPAESAEDTGAAAAADPV